MAKAPGHPVTSGHCLVVLKPQPGLVRPSYSLHPQARVRGGVRVGPTGAPERPSMAAPAREWRRGEGPGRRALRLWRLSADICASRAELWFGLVWAIRPGERLCSPLIKRSRMLILAVSREAGGARSPGDGDRFLHHVCKPAPPIDMGAAGARRPPSRHPQGSGSGRFGFQTLWGSLETTPWEVKGCLLLVPDGSAPVPHALTGCPGCSPPTPTSHLAPPRPPSALCLLPALRPQHLPRGAPPAPTSPSPLQASSLLSPAWQGH